MGLNYLYEYHFNCMSLMVSIVILSFLVIIWGLKKLKQIKKELEILKNHLESLVENRTKELKQSNEQLQEEILKREHAQETLRRAKEAAESANRAKSDYLANLSHELRTPLNVILGFSQLLERKSDATIQQREHLNIIHSSSEHLLSLINDVLEVSKIEAGQIRLHSKIFNLHDSVKGIAEMIGRRAEEKGLSFQVNIENTPKYIQTDESKLRQILINLLNNSIKFTNSGAIQLRVFVSKSVSRQLEIEIEDTGIGIPQDDMLSIFDSFSRISHDRYGIEGSGLGLAISKKLIDLLGGNISIHSKDGKGSLFRFSFKYKEVSQNRPAVFTQSKKVISVDKNWQHIQILVVEDKWENRLLLKSLLLQVGLKVIEATNGQKAIEQYLRYRPALIFMDIRMPVMSGIEATQKIRKLPQGKHVKIIAITAHAFEEFRENILAVGCDDLIRKPYRKTEIFDSISKHVGVTFFTDSQQQHDDTETIFLPQSEEIAELPADLRHKLRNAAMDLDVKEFESLIKEFQPEHSHIATTLLKLSKQFRYDQILACLNECNHVGDK